ncbi:hypothetical protein M413DRAFT_36404, partial [Hebeloma cylindrosporum]
VSFTIRRPTPVSRATSSGPDSDPGPLFKVPLPPRGSPLVRSQTSSPHPSESQADHVDNSSDEDSASEDELVTGFDKFGVQRCVSFKKINRPLVIPALKNKDWREIARKRRNAAQYVPPSAAAATGADGSVGGLGTKDTINSGPVLSGLQVKQRVISVTQNEDVVEETTEVAMQVVEEETEDQKALRAILAEASGENQDEGPILDIIPPPISETDALKQDVEDLPDAATLEDYARVPVSQFGAALLRGMGWKEGTAASRKPGKGLVEPYLPSARPALLGIGAKEQEVFDDGNKNNKRKRPERRYMPVVKQDRTDTASPNGNPRDRRERSRSPRRSTTSSRRNSPDRYTSRSEKDRSSSKRSYDHDDKERRAEDRDRRDDDRRRNYERESRQKSERDRRRDDGQDRSDRNRERSRR